LSPPHVFRCQALTPHATYTLSLHDALPILETPAFRAALAYSTKALPEYQKLVNLEDPTKQILNVGLGQISSAGARAVSQQLGALDRKSTRLNSSHVKISYAVFCLKKQKITR